MIARFCLLTLGLLSAWISWGQGRVHLYPDDNLVFRDMIAHVDGDVVRMGPSWRGDIVYTLQADNMWDEVAIFQGYSTSALDVAFTLRDNHLYLGDSSFSDAVLYTYHEGQIFMGDSTFPLDVAYTLREEDRKFGGGTSAPLWGLYKEDSRAWSDRLAVIEGEFDAGSLFALLSAAGWL